MLLWLTAPTMGTPDITPAEARLLTAVAEHGGVAYNTGNTRRDRADARVFERLSLMNLVSFTNAEAGGWERDMWSAHLLAVGWNTVFRHHTPPVSGNPDEPVRERHIGVIDIYGQHRRPCNGHWNPDSTCDTCRAVRPLDATAYDTYLTTLSPEDRTAQEKGPRLWCPEHGRMRLRDITTQKVCRLPGTDFHDGGLNRI